jgi:hypothetical protein
MAMREMTSWSKSIDKPKKMKKRKTPVKDRRWITQYRAPTVWTKETMRVGPRSDCAHAGEASGKCPARTFGVVAKPVLSAGVWRLAGLDDEHEHVKEQEGQIVQCH